MMSEDYRSVLAGLCNLIFADARVVSNEMDAPGASPDDSDDKIRRHRERYLKLVSIRNQFEETMTGFTVP